MDSNSESQRLVTPHGMEYPYSKVAESPNDTTKTTGVPVQLEMSPTGPSYNPQVEAQLTGDWSDGICSCCSDLRSLLIGCICFPALFYLIMIRLPSHSRRQSAVFGIELLADPIISTLVFIFSDILTCGCLGAYMVYVLAEAVAERYKIYESVSCCEACCCQPCLLMKLSRHVDRAQGYIKYK